MAAKIKISETTVLNAKDFHVYNKQLNDFTHPNKLIPFTSKTDTYEKNSNSGISNIMRQPTKIGGYKTSSKNLVVKKSLEQELTQIMVESKKFTRYFCS